MTAPNFLPNYGTTGIIQDPGLGNVLGQQLQGIARMLLLRRESDQRQQQQDQLADYYRGLLQNEQDRQAATQQQQMLEQAIQGQVGQGLTQLQSGNEQMAMGLGGGVQIPGLNLPAAPRVSAIAGRMAPQSATEFFKQGEAGIKRREGIEGEARERQSVTQALNEVDPVLRKPFAFLLGAGAKGLTAEARNVFLKTVMPDEQDPDAAVKRLNTVSSFLDDGLTLGEAADLVGIQVPDTLRGHRKPRAAAGGAGGGGPQEARDFQREMQIRNQWEQVTKDHVVRADQFGALTASLDGARQQNPASQMAMIFAFMKMVDPRSSVREREYANAQNATGVPQRVRNMYNKVLKGTILNPSQIEQFYDEARAQASSGAAEVRKQREGSFRPMVQRWRVDEGILTDPYERVLPEGGAGAPTLDASAKAKANEARKLLGLPVLP